VLEISFQVARRFGDAHVVGDDLGELLGVGEQPAVGPVDDSALDARRHAKGFERLPWNDAVTRPPQDGDGHAAIAQALELGT